MMVIVVISLIYCCNLINLILCASGRVCAFACLCVLVRVHVRACVCVRA